MRSQCPIEIGILVLVDSGPSRGEQSNYLFKFYLRQCVGSVEKTTFSVALRVALILRIAETEPRP
jgi:hypothetical protein